MMAVWQHMKFNCCLFYVKLQTPDLVISAHVGKLLSQKPPRKCFQQQKKNNFCIHHLPEYHCVDLKPDSKLKSQ